MLDILHSPPRSPFPGAGGIKPGPSPLRESLGTPDSRSESPALSFPPSPSMSMSVSVSPLPFLSPSVSPSPSPSPSPSVPESALTTPNAEEHMTPVDPTGEHATEAGSADTTHPRADSSSPIRRAGSPSSENEEAKNSVLDTYFEPEPMPISLPQTGSALSAGKDSYVAFKRKRSRVVRVSVFPNLLPMSDWMDDSCSICRMMPVVFLDLF